MTTAAVDAASASPENARNILARSRFIGRISMVMFLIAVFSVVDGLQMLVRQEFNRIDLLPGETVLMSGMLPADAKTHEDLVIRIDGASGLSFTPLETYKGFWMGGHMWRAELSAASGMKPGEVTITIVDIIKPDASAEDSKDVRDRSILYGGQQNPALVHTITIWASEKERRAANHSILYRLLGISPFGMAGFCLLLALVTGLTNWLVFGQAEKALAVHAVFVVHGVKQMAIAARQALPGQVLAATSGLRVAFFHLDVPVTPGEPVILMDREGQERARGRILDIDKARAHALFPEDTVVPRYGWLVVLADRRPPP
ncbi:hypothetical protein LJC22_05220 [Desulfosarcina sp. OttesenSCG-928-G10]|nr:hypothetical protein [Desulfosarcina sp. OttesenSCG-928-G10]